ncbi:FdhF/YdeP family oxidoreductase [Patulibacter defluvii]|uniref:FdhF/YdeP family oxidoreductase n=2 Tax=Bacteria TaxID=2 RepID=UPI002A74DED7|nr:FdhF/YdeP family oxidoreductase [Patulibacter sp. DM4]
MSRDRDVPEDDAGLRVGPPVDHAVGMPATRSIARHTMRQMGAVRTARVLGRINQPHGFDCPGCAWPEPDHETGRPGFKHLEFCENGAKAVAEEATRRTVERDFFARHPVAELHQRSEHWLSQQGRLTEPMHLAPGADHYVPIAWEDAFALIADELRALDSPDEALFYTSGRTSNEAAFLYQLLVRCFGTNNLPDCSNMCHESSGSALVETIGIGKGSVTVNDLVAADLIIVAGQNPGTNHPRMLTTLEQAKEQGARIMTINPLPEAGLQRFDNPQRLRGLTGHGTPLTDLFLQLRLGGDLALFQALNRLLLDADAADPDAGIVDHAFLRDHCEGTEALRDHLADLSWPDVERATGLTRDQIDEALAMILPARRIVVCWAMGLTQHRDAVATIREVVNFLLLRGNIGRKGAGLCPVRGHSNVQGDRTMGIWEKPDPGFLDRQEATFGVPMPRAHGHDVVDSIRALRDGRARVLFAVGGNFASATPDTEVTEAALRRARLTVQVSTKLNRSHTVTGRQALILPTLGRTDRDLGPDGQPRFVTVEDSMSVVHASRGRLAPPSESLRSEVEIVAGLARALFGPDGGPGDGGGDGDGGGPRVGGGLREGVGLGEGGRRAAAAAAVPWEALAADYGRIRDRIEAVVPGFERFNERAAWPGGFVLPHGPRDARRFDTPSGRARLTVNALEPLECPPGRLLLQSLRSHDQYNTTVYGLDDRYRGISGGRRVVFVHPDDLAELGLADGQQVDLVSEWRDGRERRADGFRLVAYPTARGCAAAYYPETNPLVPLDSTARTSNTPTSKAIVVRLEP